MFWPIWPSSGVKIFLIRKLVSSVANIYAGPLCVVFFFAVCFAPSKEEHNMLTPTHKHTEGTCIYIKKEDSIFPIKKILTPDDGHTGWNM